MKAVLPMSSLGRMDQELFRPFRPGDVLQLEDLEISTFQVSHDAAQPVCYSFSDGRKKACIVTDLGCVTEDLIDGRQFFAKVNAGEPIANDVLRRFCRQVAMQIANLTILLDLEKVAIGGGISKQPVLIETIRECLDVLYRASNVYFDNSLPKTEIVPCRYGSETNQVGAYFNYMDAMGR